MTLTAWSAILLYFYFSGRISAFLHPVFRPFVLISGGVMILLAIGLAISPLSGDECCEEEGCAHSLGRMTTGRILTFLILLLPIGAAAAISSDGFGAGTMMNRGIVNDATGLKAARQTSLSPTPQQPVQPQQPTAADEYLPKSKSGNVLIQVTDLLYAAQDSSLRSDFQGKTIELTGQLMPDNINNPNGNRFKLVRMLMVCCAADARPVAVLVDGGANTKIPEMSWVRVTGRATFPTEGGRMMAVVKADSVVVSDPPEETMLY